MLRAAAVLLLFPILAAAGSIEMVASSADSLFAAGLGEQLSSALAEYGELPGGKPYRFILASDRDEFLRLARGRSPEWAAAIVLERGRTVLLDKETLMRAEGRTRILKHELAHLVLDRIAGRESSLPRWLHEGFAQVRAAQWDMQRLWRLARAAWSRTGIPLADLRRQFPLAGPRAALAYDESQAAVRELLRRPEAWRGLMDGLRRGTNFQTAFRDSYGEDLFAFESRFDAEILPSFRRWGLLLSTPPLFFGMMLLGLAGGARRRWVRRKAENAAPLGERPQFWIEPED